jgi:hypothetical protein
MVENKTPNHYTLEIGNKTIQVNDILQAIYKTVDTERLQDVSCMKWNYYCNAVEYLLRALRKGQLISDIKKCIHELEFYLKEVEVEEATGRDKELLVKELKEEEDKKYTKEVEEFINNKEVNHVED